VGVALPRRDARSGRPAVRRGTAKPGERDLSRAVEPDYTAAIVVSRTVGLYRRGALRLHRVCPQAPPERLAAHSLEPRTPCVEGRRRGAVGNVAATPRGARRGGQPARGREPFFAP